MRWYRANDGTQQLFIKDATLEEIAESELVRARLMPTADRPVVDIEAFIERHLGADLDAGAVLESTILGLTELRAGANPRVLVNRDLTDAALEIDAYSGKLGRWRATLAHEAAHVLLHGFVFELNADQTTLFSSDGGEAEQRLFRCLKREVLFVSRSGRDPREVQANKGMAALLMPRTLFGSMARDGASRMTETELGDSLARAFEVSRQAAHIRLSTLGFLESGGRYVTGIIP
jgi:hypothetical protein